MTARPGSDYPNGAVTGAVNVLRVAFLRRFRNGVPVSASSLRQAGTGEPCEAARAPFPPPLAPTSPRHPFASWRRSGGVLAASLTPWAEVTPWAFAMGISPNGAKVFRQSAFRASSEDCSEKVPALRIATSGGSDAYP